MPKIDVLIMGESEIVLNNICNLLSENKSFENEPGIAYRKNNKHQINKPQKILNNLDCISPYDYSIFDDQSFLRPYNGDVVRAIDYEVSRGCIYTCSYCVETIIQKYYGFNENNNNGALKNFKNYRRNKSAKITFQGIKFLNENLGIKVFRCQDTNFLTIESKMLSELSNLIKQSKLDIKLYIETRAEGINDKSIQLLKDLKVDGVGMGIELSVKRVHYYSLFYWMNIMFFLSVRQVYDLFCSIFLIKSFKINFLMKKINIFTSGYKT